MLHMEAPHNISHCSPFKDQHVDDLWPLGGFSKKSGQPVGELKLGTLSSCAPRPPPPHKNENWLGVELSNDCRI